MVVLTSDRPNGRVGKSGLYHCQVELNGGTATLQIKIQGSNSFVDFEDNVLVDGIAVYNLPRGYVQISSVTGSPVVYIEDE